MAMKEIIYGICGTSRCKLPTYSQEKIDEIVEETNTKIENTYTKEEIENLLGGKIDNELPYIEDFNDTSLKPGFYYSDGKTLNAPNEGTTYFVKILKTINKDSDGNERIFITQIAYRYRNNAIHERQYNTIEPVGWKEWAKIYTTDDYAVLKSSITLSKGAGDKIHSYPTGFTMDNCVVLSVNVAHDVDTDLITPSYSYGVLPDGAGLATDKIYNKVTLGKDDITVSISDGTESGTNKYKYKVVLMKIN